MSPELIDPQRFGFRNGRPTKESDCYALGMVIYEILSGRFPFYRHADLAVILKVLAGERPPRVMALPENLWMMLQLCWASRPNDRPGVEDVLQCLEMASGSLGSLYSTVYGGMEGGDEDSASDSSGMLSRLILRGGSQLEHISWSQTRYELHWTINVRQFLPSTISSSPFTVSGRPGVGFSLQPAVLERTWSVRSHTPQQHPHSPPHH